MSSEKHKSRKGTRQYRQGERARQAGETRRRITEAVVHLHRTVGPARTTISEVADRAGVGRMTVYKHFPDEVDLIAACSAHWSQDHPMPDFSEGLAIDDVHGRLVAVLERLYKYYANGYDMLGKIIRDAPGMPALQQVLEADWYPALGRLEVGLVRGLSSSLSSSQRKRVRAAIRLALDIRSWETMTSAGLSEGQCAKLAADMVSGVISRCHTTIHV